MIMSLIKPEATLVMQLDPDNYEQARQTRDARFDGRIFVGVLTTGIYCRPICPVRIPKKENVQIYKTAAAAAAAGFRPCLRCRPESSPGTPAWNGASSTVDRALQMIGQGMLDSASVASLAARLDIGPRQLTRLFHKYLGASPISVAQTRRLHFAKKLIDETALPLTDICFAAGFNSVRRFNACFLETYKRPPGDLRKSNAGKTVVFPGANDDSIEISLSYRPPFDWQAMLEFLAYRSIPGVEQITPDSYARTIRLGGKVGDFSAHFSKDVNEVVVKINFPDARALYQIVEKIRLLFDLNADSGEVASHFESDALLMPIVERFPGLRVPGCWDGFEVVVRAILGQQVSVKSASTLVARIAEKHGEGYNKGDAGLTRVFPDAGKLVEACFEGLGIIGQRINAIKAVANMVANDQMRIDSMTDSDDFVAKICQVKGIGEWTAQYIAMRALNDPNAFPHSDLILLRAAASSDKALTPKQLLERAMPWQPWRSYAVLLLWKQYSFNALKSKPNQADTL